MFAPLGGSLETNFGLTAADDPCACPENGLTVGDDDIGEPTTLGLVKSDCELADVNGYAWRLGLGPAGAATLLAWRLGLWCSPTRAATLPAGRTMLGLLVGCL